MRTFDGFGYFGQETTEVSPTWGEPGTPEEFGVANYAARVYDAVTKKPVAGAVVYLQMSTPTGLVNVAKGTSDASGVASIAVTGENAAKAEQAEAGGVMLFAYTGVRGYKAGKVNVSSKSIDLPLVPLAGGEGGISKNVLIVGAVAVVALVGIFVLAKK